METILITGSSRGLGLEFTRQYAAAGHRVIATCRHPERADALREVADAAEGRVRIETLDVTAPASIDRLAGAAADEPIDILLHNAGVFPDKAMGFGSMQAALWLEALQVNTIAPLKLTEALVDNVAASDRKLVAVLSSLMGSLEDNSSGGYYAYRSSKAAVNMVVRSMAIDLAPRGIACVILHPGWVQTDMGGPGAPLEAPESVTGMRAVLASATTAETGRFFRYDGTPAPW